MHSTVVSLLRVKAGSGAQERICRAGKQSRVDTKQEAPETLKASGPRIQVPTEQLLNHMYTCTWSSLTFFPTAVVKEPQTTCVGWAEKGPHCNRE